MHAAPMRGDRKKCDSEAPRTQAGNTTETSSNCLDLGLDAGEPRTKGFAELSSAVGRCPGGPRSVAPFGAPPEREMDTLERQSGTRLALFPFLKRFVPAAKCLFQAAGRVRCPWSPCAKGRCERSRRERARRERGIPKKDIAESTRG